MSNPTDVIISGINININSFQFNSYAVLPGVFCAKYQHSRHLSTSRHFNLKERQSFWPRETLSGKEHVINMQIRNNYEFVSAQRTNGQNLSRIDRVTNFLWIFKEFIQFCVWTPAISNFQYGKPQKIVYSTCQHSHLGIPWLSTVTMIFELSSNFRQH